MKVLLLAAGRSKRLKPIEDKNFLRFLGKPLIQHQIDQIMAAGLKEIILVGGAHNLEALKKLARGISSGIKVVEQKHLDEGMAGAVLAAEKLIKKEELFIVSANDVVDEQAYKLVLNASKDRKFDSYILGKKVSSYFPGGYLRVKPNGQISGIVEKPGAGKEPSKMVNLVLHFHRDAGRLIETLKATKSARDDRYELALDKMMKAPFSGGRSAVAGSRMKLVPYSGFWQPIKYPWHVITMMHHFLGKVFALQTFANSRTSLRSRVAEKFLRGRIGGKKAEVAKSATIRGDVYLEEGVRVLDNAVIIGPAYIGKNTVIATNAMVRDSHIGENCVIGFGSEITRSFVGDCVWTHCNYIGDSIIGNNNSFGSGTVTGNLRLDEANIPVNINGEKIDSGTNKFGLITGANVRCGINTSFMPGIKIGNNSFIGAGITVAQDIEDNKFVYGKTELHIKDNKAKLDTAKRETMKKNFRNQP